MCSWYNDMQFAYFLLMIKSCLYTLFKKLIINNIYNLFLILTLISCSDYNHQDIKSINLVIQNHRFIPEEIILPKNTKIHLIITNHDNIAEEFECLAIRREKLIPANSTIKLSIPPLKEGIYEFIGEFNPKSAKGRFKVE